jgi:hydrogenase-4 transcriptional activator
MANLMSYPWPGNIRELQNVLERAVVLSAGSTLRLDKGLVPLVASEDSLPVAEIPVPEAQPAARSSSEWNEATSWSPFARRMASLMGRKERRES